MSSIQIGIENFGFSSQTLSSDHLGANLLFHSDRVTRNSDFDEVVAKTSVNFIRYPGGTISEEYFDIANPNSTDQSNVIDILTGTRNVRTRDDLVALEGFLTYSNAISSRASIVLPTFRYFDQYTGQVSQEAEAEIRTFIRNLLNDVYGPTKNLVLEIGNEWYQNKFDWSVEEFGITQATIASWIDDEARKLGLRESVTILAQAGRSQTDNNVLSSFFQGNAQKTIDGVLTHLYGTNSTGDPLGIGSGIRNRLDSINDAWSSVLGLDFELAVTEWNVGENGEDDTTINGLMRLAPLMRIYGEMLIGGVDLAMIWSIQTNGPAGLSGAEGTGSDLSPTGLFYSMLSHSIQGMRLVDAGNEYRLRDAAGETVGYTYSFAEDKNLVSYFVSGIEDEIALTVDLTEFKNSDAYVYATVLGSTPGDSGTEYWSSASLQHLTAIDLSSDNGWEFIHVLNPYEMVELHVVVGEGVSISGDTQSAIADSFVGSRYSDQLSGGAGDDTLFGAEGEDLLSGEKDHDTLEGGQDNDTLLGGHGHDYLSGGSGDDFLDGGDWNDTMVSGEGRDTLIGADGDDLLQMDGGGGIANGGAGQDTLSFLDSSAGVTIWVGEGMVELNNFDTVKFSGIEIFQGSPFSDRVSVISDAGQFFGGDGDDKFEALGGARNTIWAEDGDDIIHIYSSEDSRYFGGSGDDYFKTFSGTTSLIGESGDDRFYLYSAERDQLIFRAGDGADSVVGFQVGLDQIELHGLVRNQMQITENSNGTLLDFGHGGSISLSGVSGFNIETDIFFIL